MILNYLFPVIFLLVIVYFDALNDKEKNKRLNLLNSLTKRKNYSHSLIASLTTISLYYIQISNINELTKGLSMFSILTLTILFFTYYDNVIRFFKEDILIRRELKAVLIEIRKTKNTFNNKAFNIIENEIKDYIFRNKENIIKEVKNGKSSEILANDLINSISLKYFESGNYPYLGKMGLNYSNGYYLHILYKKTLDKKVKLGVMNQTQADNEKTIVKNKMSKLIQEKPIIY